MDTEKRQILDAAAESTMHADARIALIKPAELEGQPGYVVHGADGTPLGWFDQRDVAIAAARQHNLTPVSVH